MGDLVNLRQVRKAKRRMADEAAAATNRARFGASKREHAATVAEKAFVERTLDGAKLPGAHPEHDGS